MGGGERGGWIFQGSRCTSTIEVSKGCGCVGGGRGGCADARPGGGQGRSREEYIASQRELQVAFRSPRRTSSATAPLNTPHHALTPPHPFKPPQTTTHTGDCVVDGLDPLEDQLRLQLL